MSLEPTPKEKKFPIIAGIVIACPFCGDQWDDHDATNTVILCHCGKKFKVQLIEQ